MRVLECVWFSDLLWITGGELTLWSSATTTLITLVPHVCYLVLLNMCSSSEEQSIYKLDLLKRPEVTRLFTFLRANFYPQTPLLLTKCIHLNPCFQQLNTQLINFLSSPPGWLSSWVFFLNKWAGQETQPLSTNQGPALCPGVAWSWRPKRERRAHTAALGRQESAGLATLSSVTAEGHSKNCCCWDLSGGFWWLPTGFSFSLSLATDCFSRGVCCWNFIVTSRGHHFTQEGKERRPLSQSFLLDSGVCGWEKWGCLSVNGCGAVSLTAVYSWATLLASLIWNWKPENIFLKSKECDRIGECHSHRNAGEGCLQKSKITCNF